MQIFEGTGNLNYKSLNTIGTVFHLNLYDDTLKKWKFT